jgi:hypothetical protein
MTTLHHAVDQHLTALTERLDRASSTLAGDHRAGERRACTDEFLVATAQHVTAMIQVVLPAVHQHLPEGRTAVREYVVSAKRLERALVITKAKQYGQAQNVGRAWSQVWGSVRDDLVAVTDLERRMVDQLSGLLSDIEEHALGNRLAAVARRSPTRPHPHLPHRGVAGRVARGMWGRADRVWDELEGRVTRPLTS